MKSLKFLVYFCFIILSVFIAWNSFMSYNTAHGSKYYELVTKESLRLIIYSLNEYEHYYGKMPYIISNSSIDNKYLLSILRAESNTLENPQKIVFIDGGLWGDELNDSWNQPIHIVWSTSNDVVHIGNNIVPVKIAAWSDGKNKKNQYGKGDDICSWK